MTSFVLEVCSVNKASAPASPAYPKMSHSLRTNHTHAFCNSHRFPMICWRGCDKMFGRLSSLVAVQVSGKKQKTPGKSIHVMDFH